MTLKFRPAKELMDEHPPCYEAEWYCENEDCVVREIWIHIKDYDGVATDRAVCPFCQQPAKFHGRGVR